MSAPRPLRAPGPRGSLILGNLREFRADVLGLLTNATASHGDMVRCRLGPHVVHLLNHPEPAAHVLQRHSANYDKHTRSSAALRLITRESLLTGNGEFWKRQRRMDQPAFHHRRIAGFAGHMSAACGRMLESWTARGEGAPPLDLASEMSRLTYAIVGRSLFSFEAGEDAATIERALRHLLPFVFRRLGQVAPPPLWVPTPANRRFRRALADVDRVVHRIIAEHRKAGDSADDLLDLLMQARDPDTGAGLGDDQLRNETLTFLLAGHETTANALSWAFHLLSLHPEIADAVAAEAAAATGDRAPGVDDLPNLALARRVIQEAIRLFPPIWIIERRAIAADLIGGFSIPAGSSVVIAPYTLHRHPAFWEDPERFDPSRFEERPPAAYLPFGAGPRFCIGSEFAMMEAVIILAMVSRRFRLTAVPGHPVEPMPDITLRPRHGLAMTLSPRG